MKKNILEKFEMMLEQGSKSDKIIMHHFLSNFPLSALGNLPTIAKDCGVSLATVQRCIVKLGYDGFADFHKDMLSNLENYKNSHPLERLKNDGGETLETNTHYEYNITNIRKTFDTLDPNLIQQAVDLLSKNSHTIYCIGGRFTGVLVSLFARNIKTIRPNVIETNPYEGFLLDTVNNCDKNTVILITDIRRYDNDLLSLSRLAKTEKQAKIILLTDTWLSPIHKYADITIPVFTGTDACWDSNVAMLTMLEEIMGQLTLKLGKKAQKFLENRERFRTSINQ